MDGGANEGRVQSGQTPSRFVLLICGSGGGENFYISEGFGRPPGSLLTSEPYIATTEGKDTCHIREECLSEMDGGRGGGDIHEAGMHEASAFLVPPSPWVAIDTKGRKRKGMTRAIDPRHEWKGGKAREGGREGPSKTKGKGRVTKDSPFS